MKRLLLFVLLLAGVAKATPFLTCDPYPAGLDPATNPVSFVIKGLSTTPISTPAVVNADGTVVLMYDLAGLTANKYTVLADAVNQAGGVSPDSAPFTFFSGVPAAPTGLKIVP